MLRGVTTFLKPGATAQKATRHAIIVHIQEGAIKGGNGFIVLKGTSIDIVMSQNLKRTNNGGFIFWNLFYTHSLNEGGGQFLESGVVVYMTASHVLCLLSFISSAVSQ